MATDHSSNTPIRTPSCAVVVAGDTIGSKSKRTVDRRNGKNSQGRSTTNPFVRAWKFIIPGSCRTDYDQKVREDEILGRDPGVHTACKRR